MRLAFCNRRLENVVSPFSLFCGICASKICFLQRNGEIGDYQTSLQFIIVFPPKIALLKVRGGGGVIMFLGLSLLRFIRVRVSFPKRITM